MSLIEDFKDRIPTKVLANGAVRYEEFDENGNSLGFKYIKRADEPAVVGNLWNKVTYDGIKEEIDNLNAKGYVVGSYTGDGNETQFIDVGFTPLAVLIIENKVALENNSTENIALALIDSPTKYNSGSTNLNALEIVENGFNVAYLYSSTTGRGCYLNKSNAVFNYIVLK